MSENHQLQELMSALMDDELSEHEFQRLLRAVEQNDEMRQTWSRYQMVSAAIKGDSPVNPQWDISSHVAQAIADEAPLQEQAPASVNVGAETKPTVKSGLVRFAVAASVTLAVVFGVTQNNFVPGSVTPGVVTAGTEDPSLAQTVAQPPVQSVNQPVGFLGPQIQAATVSTGQSNKSLSTNQVLSPQVVVTRAPNAAERQELQRRLDKYILQHAEHSALNSGRGLLPFARVSHEQVYTK